MKNIINDGIYPVMLTPFFEDKTIDYKGLENFTEWFIKKGCQGLFAVCGSSEMGNLTLDEKLNVAKTVIKTVNGRNVDVVVSGHTAETTQEQIEQINETAKLGIDAYVLVSGRVAKKDEDDTVFVKNIEKILANTGNTTYGIYECPSPYNRQLSPEIMKYLADTNRFVFSKDTCCSFYIGEKIKPTLGSNFKVYNAFTTLCLEAFKYGGRGFSGIMLNYHPDLYVKLWELFQKGDIETCEKLQAYITVLGKTEMKYNIGTKYYLKEFEKVDMATFSRSDEYTLSDVEKYEFKKLFEMTQQIRAQFNIK